ncbi:MAG: coproporphyrinogen III oxidase, partial [Clostridia bacterium]
VYNLLKKYNVNNINVDLIYPLPGLDIKILNDTLDKILALDIPHISVYNLEIHENTKLDFLLKNNFLKLPNEDIEYEMKELIENKLKKNMYNKYEISNFSKEGFESIHNLNYWNQGYYLGFGVCSSSFLNSTRYSNIDNIEDYINYYLYNDKKINIIKESSDLDDNELIKEYIILKLRLDKGVSILTINKKYNINVLELFKDTLNKLKNNKLISIDTNIYLTKKGQELANLVWQEFI